jgi:hypothetical protein
MKKQGFELEPGVFPYTPDPSPNPDIEPGPERRDDPDRNDDPERDPKHGRRVSGKSKSSLDAMKEVGSTPIPEIKSNIHCLTIIGQIEGHLVLPPQNKTTKYEHMIPQLVALEQAPEIEGILIVLNTVGGDVEAGLAIAEMIAGMSKPSVSVVFGWRTLDWRANCRRDTVFLYCQYGQHDHSPDPPQRAGYRCSTDV